MLSRVKVRKPHSHYKKSDFEKVSELELGGNNQSSDFGLQDCVDYAIVLNIQGQGRASVYLKPSIIRPCPVAAFIGGGESKDLKSIGKGEYSGNATA